MSTEHPFQPGVRVAVQQHDQSFREDFVHKVHKSGRFTLKSNPSQQFRVTEPRERYHGSKEIEPWHGWATGESYFNRGYVYLWTDDNQPMIDKGNAKADLDRRWQAVSITMHRLNDRRVNPTALKLFEEAIAALDPLPEPKP